MGKDIKNKSIAIDFDGVINPYTKGYKGVGVFEEPVKESIEEIRKLSDSGWAIIINTCRGEIEDIKRYLNRNNIYYDYINENPDKKYDNLSDKKVYANVYLDDKAINFDGSWDNLAKKIEKFKPWHIGKNRKNLGFSICDHTVDQIALFVSNIKESIKFYKSQNFCNWIEDIVISRDIISGKEFKVHLAFNYDMYPCEFELIQIVEGNTVQIPNMHFIESGISHYGFHTENIDESVGKFEKFGFKVASDVETISHSSCNYLYRYVFIDTTVLGFYSKLIKRI